MMWKPEHVSNLQTQNATIMYLRSIFFKPEHMCTDFEMTDEFRMKLWDIKEEVENKYRKNEKIVHDDVVASVKALYPEEKIEEPKPVMHSHVAGFKKVGEVLPDPFTVRDELGQEI